MPAAFVLVGILSTAFMGRLDSDPFRRSSASVQSPLNPNYLSWMRRVPMNHYFSQNPDVEHHLQTVTVSARHQTVKLYTDNGVFSKRGLDYGTRVMIESVVLPEGGTVVDLGCGYGAVTSVLAQVYPKTKWVLLDVNRRAVDLAALNADHLHLTERTLILQSDGFSAVSDLTADVVLLNPPIRAGKQVVYDLFSDASAHLRSGGQLWIVIQKKQGAASAEKELKCLFAEVELVERSGGYHVYRSSQPLADVEG